MSEIETKITNLEELREHMRINGVKNVDLAAALKVSPVYTSRILSGKKDMTAKFAVNIGKALSFDGRALYINHHHRKYDARLAKGAKVKGFDVFPIINIGKKSERNNGADICTNTLGDENESFK